MRKNGRSCSRSWRSDFAQPSKDLVNDLGMMNPLVRSVGRRSDPCQGHHLPSDPTKSECPELFVHHCMSVPTIAGYVSWI